MTARTIDALAPRLTDVVRSLGRPEGIRLYRQHGTWFASVAGTVGSGDTPTEAVDMLARHIDHEAAEFDRRMFAEGEDCAECGDVGCSCAEDAIDAA